MSWVDRFSETVMAYSRPVIVVMLVMTLIAGAGAGSIEQTSDLGQFQSDTPESEKLDYIDANFSTGQDNTTSSQVIVRGENVLEQDALLETLRLQQSFRENETINRTLTENQSTVGVANVIAQQWDVQQEVDELEARADQLEAEQEALENESEALENESEELENASEELEERGERLERRGNRLESAAAELEQDQAELERRTGILSDALNETAGLQTRYDEGDGEETEIEAAINETLTNATAEANLSENQTEKFRNAASQVRTITSDQRELRTSQAERDAAIETGVNVDSDNASILSNALNETIRLQTEYDELNRTHSAGNVSDAEHADKSEQLETEINETLNDAIEDANLGDEQAETFTGAAETVRDETSEINQIQFRYEPRSVSEALEGAFQAGTQGVFADEFAELQERGQNLESRGNSLESSGQSLQDRREELEEWGEELEERGEELEEWGNELEERGEQLEEDFEALEERDSMTLAEQIETIEAMNATAYDDARQEVLGENASDQFGGASFMPTSYDAGSTQANATMMIVTHQSEGDGGGAGGAQGATSDELVDAQLAMQSVASEEIASEGSDVIVFGGGIMTQEIENSMVDSLAIVGPLALLFVVVTLVVAYRDLLDILLGLVGIVTVLIWTFGFMGWAGIDFNQMFIAVPVLLIGLSIDYAIHIFMRHREQRQAGGAYGDDDTRGSMRIALAGVGIALVLVTATTAIGFLSNLTSPVPPIQDFGIVSAVGITVALLVFGILIPALKVELDEFFENRGYDRKKRAFGTGGGRFSQLLSLGSTAARRLPIVVILVAVLVSAGGAYGATQVDTSFNQEDFIAEDPPEWTNNLPGPLAPGDYSMKENLEYVNDNFVREDSQAQILVEGDVTDPETLQRLEQAENDAADSDVTITLSSGEADIQSPLRTMEDVAADNESFNETFTDADTDGDEVPDRNLEAVYDELFAVAEDDAGNVIYRTEGGEYESVRLIVSTSGSAAMSDVTSEMRAIADGLDGDGLEATATGQTILFDIVQEQLMDTVIESLLITLVAVFAFLMIAYRLTKGSALLGAVTLLPVVFSVSWILGTMYLLGISFNVMTGMITSLTVGLGVAYSIHMTERYSLELDRTGSVWESMSRTITGTGGALLGSAATTVGGFGVLVFAILPPLQQFGIITGLTIIYAFLASVLVLPSLLVVWTKYLGPDVSFDVSSPSPSPTASDGGQPADQSEPETTE